MKKLYPLEKVSGFVGLTRQTLCNWSGCNSGYKVKNAVNKNNAAAAAFIIYHLYGRNRMDTIKNALNNIEKSIKKLPDIKKNKQISEIKNNLLIVKEELSEIKNNLLIVKEELKVIDEIYNYFKNKKYNSILGENK